MPTLGSVGFEICKQSDRQTDRHIHHNTLHLSHGQSNDTIQCHPQHLSSYPQRDKNKYQTVCSDAPKLKYCPDWLDTVIRIFATTGCTPVIGKKFICILAIKIKPICGTAFFPSYFGNLLLLLQLLEQDQPQLVPNSQWCHEDVVLWGQKTA